MPDAVQAGAASVRQGDKFKTNDPRQGQRTARLHWPDVAVPTRIRWQRQGALCPTGSPVRWAESRRPQAIIEGPNPHRAEARPHPVVGRKLDHRNGEIAFPHQSNGEVQARAMGKIALRDVTVDDSHATLTGTGEEHLYLGLGGVLCIIQKHEGIAPGPTPHNFEGHHFDVAVLYREIKHGLAQSVTHGICHRDGPGRELGLEVPGKNPGSDRMARWAEWE